MIHEPLSTIPRHRPKCSLVVVVPEHQPIEPETLAYQLSKRGDDEVVVVCAGSPENLNALRRSAGDAEFLVAPSGTTTEDLRALGMGRASGDIVTLLNSAMIDHAAGRTHLSRAI